MSQAVNLHEQQNGVFVATNWQRPPLRSGAVDDLVRVHVRTNVEPQSSDMVLIEIEIDEDVADDSEFLRQLSERIREFAKRTDGRITVRFIRSTGA